MALVQTANDLLFDSFTGANGTNIQSHTPEAGGAWVAQTNQPKLDANNMFWSGGGFSRARMDLTIPENEIDIGIDGYHADSSGSAPFVYVTDPGSSSGRIGFSWNAGNSFCYAVSDTAASTLLPTFVLTHAATETHTYLFRYRRNADGLYRLTVEQDGTRKAAYTIRNGKVPTGIVLNNNQGNATTGYLVDAVQAQRPKDSSLFTEQPCLVSKTDTSISLRTVTPTGGTPPYTLAWYRSTAAGTLGNATGNTSLEITNGNLSERTTYYYSVKVTDAGNLTYTSDQVDVTTNSTAYAANKLKVIVEGDSRSANTYSANLTARLTAAGYDPKVITTAQGGSATSQSWQRWEIAKRHVDGTLGTNNIYVTLLGTNQYGSETASSLVAKMLTNTNDAKAAGMRTIPVCEISQNQTNWEAFRVPYNALLVAQAPANVTAVCRADTNANIGANGSYANTTYFNGDGIHLTTTGYNVLAGEVFKTIHQVAANVTLAAPTISSANTTAIAIAWGNATGAVTLSNVTYAVDRAPDSNGTVGNWTNLATGLSNQTYSDGNLTAGTTYFYRVTATDANGATGTSATLTANTTPDLSAYTLISGVVAASDVRLNTPRYSGGSNGTLAVPGAQYVLTGQAVDAGNGTLTIPAAGNVTAANGPFGVGGNGTTPTLADVVIAANGTVLTSEASRNTVLAQTVVANGTAYTTRGISYVGNATVGDSVSVGLCETVRAQSREMGITVNAANTLAGLTANIVAQSREMGTAVSV